MLPNQKHTNRQTDPLHAIVEHINQSTIILQQDHPEQ